MSDYASPVLTSIDRQSTDIKRLKAYRLGVRDFIEKPFTDEELCIRLRRLARPAERHEPERVVFKGSIAQIGLGTLLLSGSTTARA